MVLADIDGRVYNDSLEPVSDGVANAVKLHATLIKHRTLPLLFRFEERGGVTMYYIGEKPFRKAELSLHDLLVFKERGEVYTDAVHVYDLCKGMAQVLGDGFMFSIPVELVRCD